MQASYGGRDDGAIQLEGIVNNYKVKLNKDESYTISFDAKSRTESFTVFIRLFPNQKTDLLLNGAYRFPIRYSGSVVPFK